MARPRPPHSTVYTAPISVGKSETIKAIAVVPFHKASSEADAPYVINIPITYTPSSTLVDLDALGIKPRKITRTQLIFSKQDISTITAYLAKKENRPDLPRILVGAVLKGIGYVDGVSSGIPFARVDTGTPESNGACATRPASILEGYKSGNLDRVTYTLRFNEHTFGDLAKLNHLFHEYNPDEGSLPMPGLSFHWAGQSDDPVEPLMIKFTNVSAGQLSLKGYAIITPNITFTPPSYQEMTPLQALNSILHGFQDLEFSAAYNCGLQGQISLTAKASYYSDYNVDQDPEAPGTDPDTFPQPFYNRPISTLPIAVETTGLYVVPRLILQSGISGKVAAEWTRTEPFNKHFADSIDYKQSRCKTPFGTQSPFPCSDGLRPGPPPPDADPDVSEPSSGDGLGVRSTLMQCHSEQLSFLRLLLIRLMRTIPIISTLV